MVKEYFVNLSHQISMIIDGILVEIRYINGLRYVQTPRGLKYSMYSF